MAGFGGGGAAESGEDDDDGGDVLGVFGKKGKEKKKEGGQQTKYIGIYNSTDEGHRGEIDVDGCERECEWHQVKYCRYKKVHKGT